MGLLWVSQHTADVTTERRWFPERTPHCAEIMEKPIQNNQRGEHMFVFGEYCFSGKWKRLEREQGTAHSVREEVWENEGPSSHAMAKARYDTEGVLYSEQSLRQAASA